MFTIYALWKSGKVKAKRNNRPLKSYLEVRRRVLRAGLYVRENGRVYIEAQDVDKI